MLRRPVGWRCGVPTDEDGPTSEDAAGATRRAWAVAAQKYVREHAEHLELGRTWRLLPVEEKLLGPLVTGADVVHPMSGHGLDDLALARLGARRVTGLDYSEPMVTSAQRRADELGVPCRYLRATMPRTGLPEDSADLVYTGKGALVWVDDLAVWADEMRRVLRPGGHLFVYEAHPLTPLWGRSRRWRRSQWRSRRWSDRRAQSWTIRQASLTIS